jgi:hypothetical protein
MATEGQILAAVEAYRIARLDLKALILERDAALVQRNDAVSRLGLSQTNVASGQAVVDAARLALKGLLNEA